jgi:hypothetical protein
MKRRQFISLLGGLAVTPFAAMGTTSPRVSFRGAIALSTDPAQSIHLIGGGQIGGLKNDRGGVRNGLFGGGAAKGLSRWKNEEKKHAPYCLGGGLERGDALYDSKRFRV